jgi:ribosome-binding protein aMBF1 (putative translation factor)
MLNCEAVTELCSEEMERSLRLGEKISLGTHLMVCARCAHFRKQVKTLRQVMQAYAEGRAASSGPDDEPAS